ncbi:hypothetical protein QRQ56_39015 [Bradyrhizobium sp. U531]|uniref:hypothetical protein n=1 Tax=Bradyrhizobium sp. U531 TaxID=3053458 RepID=UPI003F438FE6
MATYKNGNYLQQSTLEAFDQDHGPGAAAPYGGIYRYIGCHREIDTAASHVMPPPGHHAHTPAQGSINRVAIDRPR